jgi:hypothetical protein
MTSNFMPLHGALLISNPRNPKMARNNPLRRHQLWDNKSAATKKLAEVRFLLRSKYRAMYPGVDWAGTAANPGPGRAEYEKELAQAEATPFPKYKLSARSNPKRRKAAPGKRSRKQKRNDAIMRAGGVPLGKRSRVRKAKVHPISFLQDRRDAGQNADMFYPVASKFRSKTKRQLVARKWGNQHGSGVSQRWEVIGAQRGRRRANVSDKNRLLPVTVGPVSDKADSLGFAMHGYRAEHGADADWKGFWANSKISRPVTGPKVSVKDATAPYRAFMAQAKASGMTATEGRAAWHAQKASSNPKASVKAAYRKKHGLPPQAEDNYGALALDNYGALALDNYGALALDNPVPFVGGVAADAGKLVLTGLAGALGHAVVADKVEEILPKIPGGEMLLDLSVPEGIPLIGGMELDNTITGTIAGIALIAFSQFVGRKAMNPMIASYGSALGTGILIAGPILDFAAIGDDEDEDGAVAGLALDNYGDFYEEELGALALDNEGTFGDGMAYQLGAIAEGDAGDEYGQASLGDAFYSGADFDLGEGQALVNGRRSWAGRYGHPPRRIGRMGGVRGSASHLASKPGHRWGWLIKMIGWKNVQALAAMPPKQRVGTIKKLRENALSTFQQLQAQAVQVEAAAAPELAPVTADGADGVAGAFGAYGATVFSGQGL